ncbi:hypothetical protein D3C72_721820 [compost metagenome]
MSEPFYKVSTTDESSGPRGARAFCMPETLGFNRNSIFSKKSGSSSDRMVPHFS